MNNYNIYTNEVNKIFNLLDILQNGIENEDNKNYIDNLNEYKATIIDFSKVIYGNENNIQEGENAQWLII